PSGLTHLALPPYGCNRLVNQRLNVVACQISVSSLHIGSSLLQDFLLYCSLNELREIVVSHSMLCEERAQGSVGFVRNHHRPTNGRVHRLVPWPSYPRLEHSADSA